MREISINGAKKVAKTLVTESYMLDEETLIKLAVTPAPLEQIEKEKANARASLVLGIPVLFSFDVVKCGEQYGIIFEHIHSRTFGQQMMADPQNAERYIELYADTLKKMHSVHASGRGLVSAKEEYKKNIIDLGKLLTDEEREKCFDVIDLVPDRDTYVLRGYEPQNIMYQDGRLLMNSFTYAGYGHPIFDLSDIAVSLASTSESDLQEDFMDLILNMDKAMAGKLWKGLMHRYFKFDTEEEYEETEKLIRFFGFLKNLIMPVLAPGLRDDYKYGSVESCRKYFFPQLEEWTEKIRNISF